MTKQGVKAVREIDETHDPALESWVASANDPETDFPIQNLPFGIYRSAGGDWRGGVAIGDQIFDLAGVDADTGPTLNALAAAGPETWCELRRTLSKALSDQGKASRLSRFLTPIADCELTLPVACGDFTDFYTSYYHAYNAGRLFKPDNPVMPNFKWVPIAYNGRSSSVVPSGTPVRCPLGQTLRDGSEPKFGPSAGLDYEVELGLIMGPGNRLGEPIQIGAAAAHIFGVVLLNDWSARDIQAWEMDPLGPFLAKSFATTLSPWVVTLEALAPFRAPAVTRPEGDPQPLPYMDDAQDRASGHLDIGVEAWIRTAGVAAPHRLSRRTSYATSYWTPAQMVAHHTSNGCPLKPGDVLGTGTISGPEPDQAGALLELAKAGTQPVELPGGITRGFLEDGDEVILRGDCVAEGYRRIGFGEARGEILPALSGG